MPEKCRRSKAFEGYLRRKRGKSVGGPRLLKGTSDGNAGKVSEVSRKKKGPPTVLLCFCQRSLMLLPASWLPTEMRAQKANANGLDLHPDVVRAEALECCAVQFFAVVRMGDADELLGTFLEGFPVEIYCSVLCHDIMHVRP